MKIDLALNDVQQLYGPLILQSIQAQKLEVKTHS